MTNTFVQLAGQIDNVGDSALRRPLLKAARQMGTCHVYVGSGMESYATNLGAVPEDIVYTDRSAWSRALMRSMVCRRTNLVLNAGETDIGRRQMLSMPALGLLATFVRARGGTVSQTGLGLKYPGRGMLWPLKILSRAANLVTWRDPQSHAVIGTGHTAPDWAVAEGSDVDTILERHSGPERRQLVLSLRGDRQGPSAQWLKDVREFSKSSAVSIVVVVQVERDAELSADVAEKLGGLFVPWPDGANHAEQEQLLRRVYAKSDWVVSNRLHGLIMAMTEGAVVLPLLADTAGKLRRTLLPIGIDYELIPSEELLTTPLNLEGRQAHLREGIKSARAKLQIIGAQMGGNFRDDS